MKNEDQCRQDRQELDRSQWRMAELQEKGLVGNRNAYFSKKVEECSESAQQITRFDALHD